ncbi:MBL fold metallo-hydrolase [Pseudomonas poae]|uniref:MBL fold metallo-hydrolase n=1 Tax=Pseudomonas poae TaxID=200451 RepID=UPI0030CDEE95
MPRFTAIPVGQGDAFYFERDNFSVLVDGGRSTRWMRQKLNEIDARPLDIIVCTHNDADHVDGIIGLLRQERACDEIWLPGKWIEVIGHALKRGPSIAEKLLTEIREIPIKRALEKIENLRTGEATTYEAAHVPPQEREQPPEQLTDMAIEDYLNEAQLPYRHFYSPEMRYPFIYSANKRSSLKTLIQALTEEQTTLFIELIDALDRIMLVALLALHHEIPIRWFEYDTTHPSGGIENVLVPLNAREIQFHKPRDNSVMDVIGLTVVNKESLVLWAPPAQSMPGVLFCADSQLTDIDLSAIALNNAICTAPHHGSSDNDCAYGHISRAFQDSQSLVWARSDGRYRQRPGVAYLNTTNRFCTVCRPAETAPYQTAAQHLNFTPSNGRWTPDGTRQCNCAPAP